MKVDRTLRARLKKQVRNGVRGYRRKLTDAQVQDILESFANGEGVVSLARRCGVRENSIRYHIRKAIGE